MSFSRTQTLAQGTLVNNVTTQVFPIGAAVSAGHKIIFRVASAGTNNSFVSCTDNGAGLTWRKEIEQGASTGNYSAILSADAPAGLASGTVISLTLALTSTRWAYDIGEYAGLSTGAADQVGSQANAASTSWSSGASGSPLAQSAGELACGMVCYNGTTTLTGPGGSWTDVLPSTVAGASAQRTAIGSDISTSSNGAVTYAGTAAASASTTVCVAVFNVPSVIAPSLHQLAALGVGA